MKHLVIFLSSLLFIQVTEAAKIKQVLNDQSLAVVEFSKNESVEPGQNFIVSGNSSQCLLKVLKIDKNLATVSSQSCGDKALLTPGQKAEKSLIDSSFLSDKAPAATVASGDVTQVTSTPEATPAAVTPPSAANSEQDQKPHYTTRTYKAVSLGILINPKVHIGGKAITGTTSETGYFEYSGTSTISLGFEYSQFEPHSWNNGISIDYTRIPIDTVKLHGDVSGDSSVSVSDSFTLLTVAYAGNYHTGDFYFPVGLGLTSSSIDTNGAFTKTIATSTAAWLGVGLAFPNNVNVELISKAHTVTASSFSSGGTTFKPDNFGYISYLELKLKFLF